MREVFLGSDGALAGSKPGNILVDMTTSEPSLAVEIYDAAEGQGRARVDAPVSGGDVGAREARLSIMIGGDKDVVEALQPCWEAMGKTIIHQGGAGAGQHTKMVNQIADRHEHDRRLRGAALRLQGRPRPADRAAIGRARRGRKLVAVESRPADHRRTISTPASSSSISSRTWASPWPKRSRMGISLPGLALAHQLYVAVKAQGHGRDGTHALELALAKMSGIDWRKR